MSYTTSIIICSLPELLSPQHRTFSTISEKSHRHIFYTSYNKFSVCHPMYQSTFITLYISSVRISQIYHHIVSYKDESINSQFQHIYSSCYHFAYNIRRISQIFFTFGFNNKVKSHFEMPIPNNRVIRCYFISFTKQLTTLH